jgi:hypothetical protein
MKKVLLAMLMLVSPFIARSQETDQVKIHVNTTSEAAPYLYVWALVST